MCLGSRRNNFTDFTKFMEVLARPTLSQTQFCLKDFIVCEEKGLVNTPKNSVKKYLLLIISKFI